jgi:anaerobic glycerol-3-phosphate dehydrogenase
MILDLDARFPEGLSDETVTAVAELLNALANQWESHYFHRLRAYQANQQVDLFDAEEPWRRPVTD